MTKNNNVVEVAAVVEPGKFNGSRRRALRAANWQRRAVFGVVGLGAACMSIAARATSYSVFGTDGSGGVTMDPSPFVSPLLVGLVAIAAGAASIWFLIVAIKKGMSFFGAHK